MSGRSPIFVSALLIGLLAALYLYFVWWTVKVSAIPPADPVGEIVLASLLLRLAFVFSVKRLRRGKASLVVDVFAADVLFMAALLFVFIATGNASYLNVLKEIVPAWPAALIIVLPPFVFYRIGAAIFEGASVYSVLTSSVGLFSLFSFLAETATLRTGSETLAGISKLLLSVFLGEIVSHALTRELALTGILLYVALMYFATSEPGSETYGQAPLVLAVAGSATALGWALLATSLTQDTLLVFGIPGLCILLGVWWKTHAR